MGLITSGILCIPVYDEDAVQSVRRRLAQAVLGFALVEDGYVPMQRHLVEERLRRWADEEELDLIVTIGGTLPAPGPSALEIVPDATLAVAERVLPGLGEAMRAYAEETLPLAIIDRSVAAIRGRTLILNLPAGASTAGLFLEAVADVLGQVLAFLSDSPPAALLDPDMPDSGEQTDEPTATGDEKPAPKGLDAGDFAAFLRRNKPQSDTE